MLPVCPSSPTVEVSGLNPVKSGFESQEGYMKKKKIDWDLWIPIACFIGIGITLLCCFIGAALA